MKTEITGSDAVKAFIEPLMQENKWAITVFHNGSEHYTVQWIEHKMYKDASGKEYRDEVFTETNGDMILVQDLDLDRAKDILRRILKQQREDRLLQEQIYSLAENLIAENHEDDEMMEKSPFTNMIH